VEKNLDEIENAAQTAVLVGTSGKVMGIIALTDEIRRESARAIGDLKKEGIEHVSIVTGDNELTARAVGKAVGADEVYAQLLPHEKVKIIGELSAKYGSVAMVGDGVNDAPALAAATIGIAMGAAGSDTALETADMALMADELGKIPWAIRLSGKAHKIIMQNVGFSIAIKLVFVVLASLGIATLWMAVFADMGVSLLVILNGMRTLGSN
jgi:Cd2+/Zn2+-exporting ATPase